MIPSIRFISAGAGSGKTYRLTEELQQMLANGNVQPGGVLATTFTRKAAAELRAGVRQKLLENGKAELAVQMGQALIGTVNAVCGELLSRFAFEAGLSPRQRVLEEDEEGRVFATALEGLLAEDGVRMRQLNALALRLGLQDNQLTSSWRKEIMALASAARSNNMSPQQIQCWAKTSADTLLDLFENPHSPERDLNDELLKTITHALATFDLEHDSTKTTRNYIDALKAAQVELRQRRMPWSRWVALSKNKPGKKSAELAEPVQILAAEFERHPGLQADLREFCHQVFELAAESIAAYQQVKTRNGMLDFVDQERQLCELLDHPHVQAALAEELQVLFVDEFQDTSPIQLALFMKLAALADHVVWVGDVKQAIYSFRGSDPQLMQAVMQGVLEGGGSKETLPYSWRSRPALVNYINQLFLPVFDESLESRRKEKTKAAAVSCWHLAGSNLGQQANNLAYGIQTLVDSGYPVVDKESGVLRVVNYADIAVLCGTNEHLAGVAGGCAKAGIPVAFKRSKLLQTPEGALALACLKRLADERDTLASAEIRTLTECESPECWLAERIRFVESGAKHWLWGEVGETGEGALAVLRDLAEARKDLPLLTPSEAMELALLKGRTREAAIAWGPTANHARHRLRNLDLLLEYARTYEDQCGLQNNAATVSGLVLWLYALAQNGKDWQAEADNDRAVTLVTHHGAKGLEWPVVIALDLDSKVKPGLWNLSVLPCESEFDLHKPLQGRSLRYWPWPFGQQSSGIAVAQRVSDSPAGVAAREAAIAETQRLLYVSLTRARDHLIIALPAKKTTGPRLETLGADWLLPTGEQLQLPDGSSIPSDFKYLKAPEEWTRKERAYLPCWLTSGVAAEGLVDRNLSPSGAGPLEDCEIGEVIELGERLALDAVQDVTALGVAVHAILAAQINAPDDVGGQRAERILRAWSFEDCVAAADVVAAAKRFVEWAEKEFRPLAWQVEYPISHVLETGQVVAGFIDLLLETPSGWVIVDHKATPRPRTEWAEIAFEYSGQLAMYRAAIEAVSDKPVLGTWIHFPVGGGVLPVTFS